MTQKKTAVWKYPAPFIKDVALNTLVDLVEKLRGILTSPSQDGRGATSRSVNLLVFCSMGVKKSKRGISFI